jgi:hypothetical protein
VRRLAQGGQCRRTLVKQADHDIRSGHGPHRGRAEVLAFMHSQGIAVLIGLDTELGCSSGELELRVDVEFRVSVAQVCFDGAFAEEKVPGDVRR